jgi:uncharacterized protein (DUF1778 family)
MLPVARRAVICVYNVRVSVAHGRKEARIDLRVEVEEKELLERAARLQGKRLSEFVLGASRVAAEEALADQTRFTLQAAEMDAFLASLEEAPKVVPQLQELLARNARR